MEYHRPVLLNDSVEGLKIQLSGIYVDATFGGGGHSKSILSHLGDKGHLIAFDRDEDAKQNIWEDARLIFVAANYRYLRAFLDYYQVPEVHGILADLGVSSHQFDVPERGFSYRNEELLDMRMNQGQDLTAADIINNYEEAELVRLFGEFGQVRNAKTLAAKIAGARTARKVVSIEDLLGIIEPCIWGPRMRYLSQVFQSLRIEVNDEIESLHHFLQAAIESLAPGGRLVVITYHSVEDRAVKYWMRSGTRDGVIRKDEFGNPVSPLKVITKKPIVPAPEEIAINKRARSAKLRIAEKL